MVGLRSFQLSFDCFLEVEDQAHHLMTIWSFNYLLIASHRLLLLLLPHDSFSFNYLLIASLQITAQRYYDSIVKAFNYLLIASTKYIIRTQLPQLDYFQLSFDCFMKMR